MIARRSLTRADHASLLIIGESTWLAPWMRAGRAGRDSLGLVADLVSGRGPDGPMPSSHKRWVIEESNPLVNVTPGLDHRLQSERLHQLCFQDGIANLLS